MDALNASKLLTDEYVMKILAATFKEPKSAQELSLRFKIPIAVCYRKIHELEAVGLLECVDRVLTREGKRVRLYQSQVINAYMFFQKGKLRVKLELSSFPTREIDTTWNALESLEMMV